MPAGQADYWTGGGWKANKWPANGDAPANGFQQWDWASNKKKAKQEDWPKHEEKGGREWNQSQVWKARELPPPDPDDDARSDSSQGSHREDPAQRGRPTEGRGRGMVRTIPANVRRDNPNLQEDQDDNTPPDDEHQRLPLQKVDGAEAIQDFEPWEDAQKAPLQRASHPATAPQLPGGGYPRPLLQTLRIRHKHKCQ